jgi:hypothetical protein
MKVKKRDTWLLDYSDSGSIGWILDSFKEEFVPEPGTHAEEVYKKYENEQLNDMCDLLNKFIIEIAKELPCPLCRQKTKPNLLN